MLTDEDQALSRIFSCPQCPKIFATRSNLKRHMENPNIHNIPYVRSRDQKRWKGHSKKVVSKEETTESNNDRMRKWRAENREKNRQNDLRCRVYRLARQKFGDLDSSEKQGFVREEIARRLGRRMMMERRESNGWTPPMRMRSSIRMMSPVRFSSESPPSSPMSSSIMLSPMSDIELPFYSGSQQKIELPSIDCFTRTNSWSSSPPDFSSSASSASSPVLPHLSPTLHSSKRRTSSSSISSASSVTSNSQAKQDRRRSSSSGSINTTPVPASPQQHEQSEGNNSEDDFCVLPSMHAFLSYAPSAAAAASEAQQQQQKQQKQSSCCIPTTASKGGIKYVESNKILDEFVGVVLNYVDNATVAQ